MRREGLMKEREDIILVFRFDVRLKIRKGFNEACHHEACYHVWKSYALLKRGF